jgi:hypothetical protein
MIDNPNPKKYIIRKAYKGAYRLIDRQVLRWREKRALEAAKKSAKVEAPATPTPTRNMFYEDENE